VRRVISEETATLLSQAFEGVVERGTAKDVHIPGVRIAGKTGTARKVVDGSYVQGQYTASFVGYFPVESPEVIGVVMMDNPRRKGYYGGITSGPIFRAIAERVVNRSPTMSRTVATSRDPMRTRTVSVPDVRHMRPAVAQRMLASVGLSVKAYGEGVLVVRQKPDPGKAVEEGDLVSIVLATSGTATKGAMTVPDVRGMTIRHAMNRLVVDDFDVSIRGSGVVTEMHPSAGSKAPAGAVVTLVCAPKPLHSAVVY
jgi:beta-lactam-binding protein with PASTA domain